MQINIIEYFEKNSKRFAGKTAVVDSDKTIDFTTLEKYSKLLAREIINNGDFYNLPVAVFLPKSVENVIADIAVTYSCNIYMNIDIYSPVIRIKNIIEKIRPSLIITNRSLKNKIDEICGSKVKLIIIEDITAENDSPVDDHLILKRLETIIDTDPYCIINTSGTTGTPKGVVLSHKSFIDFTEWAVSTLNIGENEITGSLSPAYFDIYSFELCLLMSQGARLVIIPNQFSGFPVKILEFLRGNNISLIFWVPTIMVNISNLDLLSKISLPSLKKVIFAGEVFPTRHFNYWYKYLPGVTFTNLYGPIEITLDCTYFIVDRQFSDDEPIPIGFPCKNTGILILNENNKIAATGESGELCVRGVSLAMGYWNDPEKTGINFVQNPTNEHYPEIIYRTGDIVYKNERGEIIYVGRKDYQIKHLGYRIELGEIEHVVLSNFQAVKNVCVVYNNTEKQIVLFYEADIKITDKDFRSSIMKILPKYMVPTKFIHFEKLPVNPNGKIDRNSLTSKES